MTKLNEVYPVPDNDSVSQVVGTRTRGGSWIFRVDAVCESSVKGVDPKRVVATGVVTQEAAALFEQLTKTMLVPAVTAKLYAPDDEV